MGKYDSHRSIEQGAAAPKLLQCEDPHPLLGVGATPRFGRAWARRFKWLYMRTKLIIHLTHTLWRRATISLRPWHLSIPQHCLMLRWYTSIFHPRSLNDFLSDSDASRILVAQCSASPSEWTTRKTLMKPYWRRWTTLPSGSMSISDIWRLYGFFSQIRMVWNYS